MLLSTRSYPAPLSAPRSASGSASRLVGAAVPCLVLLSLVACGLADDPGSAGPQFTTAGQDEEPFASCDLTLRISLDDCSPNKGRPFLCAAEIVSECAKEDDDSLDVSYDFRLRLESFLKWGGEDSCSFAVPVAKQLKDQGGDCGGAFIPYRVFGLADEALKATLTTPVPGTTVVSTRYHRVSGTDSVDSSADDEFNELLGNARLPEVLTLARLLKRHDEELRQTEEEKYERFSVAAQADGAEAPTLAASVQGEPTLAASVQVEIELGDSRLPPTFVRSVRSHQVQPMLLLQLAAEYLFRPKQ